MLPLLLSLLLLLSDTSATHSLKRRSTCYSGVYVLSARGTSEPQNHSVLEPIVQGIVDAVPNSYGEEVQYPASLAFVASVATGLGFLNGRLTDYAAQCPNSSVVLLGYSQGAVVTSIELAGTNFGGANYPALNTTVGNNIAALIQFGDPMRVPGQGEAALGSASCSVSPNLERKGQYKTAMDSYADRLLDFCNAEDPVCCGNGNDTAAHVSYFTQNTTDTVVQFVKSHLSNPSSNTTLPTNSTSSSNSTSNPTASASSTVAVSSGTPSASASAAASTSATAPGTGAASTFQIPAILSLLVGVSVALSNL